MKPIPIILGLIFALPITRAAYINLAPVAITKTIVGKTDIYEHAFKEHGYYLLAEDGSHVRVKGSEWMAAKHGDFWTAKDWERELP